MPHSSSSTPPITPSVLPMVYPMDDFYAQMGMPLPRVESVPGEAVPEPERSLLVHGNDMTSTLTAFHQAKLHLEVLRSEIRGDYYLREVVLRLDGSNRPVEFGAIKIYLNLLPGPVRRLILDEKLPLGQILKECSVAFLSRPKAFLKVVSDEWISRALQLEPARVLYGRRNTLTDPQQRPLAEIVEILPPTAP
jgi:chorismate-pyruvate lyase